MGIDALESSFDLIWELQQHWVLGKDLREDQGMHYSSLVYVIL